MAARKGLLSLAAAAALSSALAAPEPLFDLEAIEREPLDATVLKTEEADGIVVQRVEYTSCVRTGAPDRIFGILAYPAGGTNLPAVFWSQAGMNPADTYFPKVYAKKGYFCLTITLPHAIRASQAPFDTADPKAANLTRLAIDQLRAITYITSRPEVDRNRIGVGGSSYGGFFATLLAGIDPRIKAGVAFFGAGRQDLGTNLPQFTGLTTADQVAAWGRTIDPAWRLAGRPVPFLWGASANDNWFHLPSVVGTFEQSCGEKRLAIVPQWQHGFPEHVDNELIDWLDIWLAGTRKPYNKPSALAVRAEGGRLLASWTWEGDNPAKRAELVVSYGAAKPWHGWVQRHHETLPARIEGSRAEAEIPVPSPSCPAYVYGNLLDERDVLVSTAPIVVDPAALGIGRPTASTPVNAFPLGDFEAPDALFIERSGWARMAFDTAEHHTGSQSVRIDPGAKTATALWHVPGLGHRLSLWVKSPAGAAVLVRVSGIAPQNWTSPAVDRLRRANDAAPVELAAALPAFEAAVTAGPDWTSVALDCPADGRPVEGYTLTVSLPADAASPAWIDTVRFEPVWGR